MRCLLIFLLWITVVFGVFVEDDEGYRRRGKSYDSSSSSWSSESHEGHGHHHHENRPRPSRPRPSRPRPPPRKRCDDGWMAFDRPQGMWCVKVFGISVNADTAQSLCAAQGAKLTGVQNAKERLMIADAGRVLKQQPGASPDQVIWLGARRKPQCGARSSCGPMDAFAWTDGHTTGTEGFQWSNNNPDAVNIAGHGVSSCLQLLPAMDGLQYTPSGGNWCHNNCPHGSLDDNFCNFNAFYACGKVAN
ncbi:unnamed protein product [Caenorhabditis nigoni]